MPDAMTPSPLVTVALPVGPGARADWLADALRCLAEQSLGDFEVVLALNGCPDDARAAAARACKAEPRFRAIELPEPSLPAALNAILAQARSPLISRMDADDLCAPDRLEKQVAALEAEPDLAGVGCAFEIIDAQGEPRRSIRPPEQPGRVRWRLLLGNVFAHGSMTLRTAALREAGAYDESLARGQDYDLWLRMIARGMALSALPDMLYQRRVESVATLERADAAQAQAAANRLLGAWRGLIDAGSARDEAHAQLLAQVFAGAGDQDARDAIESALDERGPSLAGLLALLLAERRLQLRVSPDVWRACWRARLREAGGKLRDAGVERVWLWGAGEHTRKLLANRSDLGVGIAGVIDDALAGATRFGFAIAPPDALEPGEHALISTDAHEARIARSETTQHLQQRGVRIWRLYSAEGTPS